MHQCINDRNKPDCAADYPNAFVFPDQPAVTVSLWSPVLVEMWSSQIHTVTTDETHSTPWQVSNHVWEQLWCQPMPVLMTRSLGSSIVGLGLGKTHTHGDTHASSGAPSPQQWLQLGMSYKRSSASRNVRHRSSTRGEETDGTPTSSSNVSSGSFKYGTARRLGVVCSSRAGHPLLLYPHTWSFFSFASIMARDEKTDIKVIVPEAASELGSLQPDVRREEAAIVSEEERRLVRKLDRRILPIACLMYLFACQCSGYSTV
ncbi:hypothetical protein BC826DRAFT_270405 [Russula brevipes]|nr:hypothetical protein BC826DRAFT_270405 [Russula brevipes]